MFEPTDDLDLDGPPLSASAAAAAAAAIEAEDDDLEEELGLNNKKPALPAAAPALPRRPNAETAATTTVVPQPSEAMSSTAWRTTADVDGTAASMTKHDDDDEDEEDDLGADVTKVAASTAKWFGGLWSAASSVVATAAASAAENVQKNQEISHALDVAKQHTRAAMTAIHADKLAESVVKATDNLGRATMASLDKMLDALDPVDDHLFHADTYQPSLAANKVKVMVTSANPVHVAAVVDVFERLHGPDAVFVKGAPTESSVAKQPIGWEAGLQGAKNRVTGLLQSSIGQKLTEERFLVVGLESFVVQILADWYDVVAVVLHDTHTGQSSHTFTQTTAVEGTLVQKCLSLTPPTYPHIATGASVTVGSLISLVEAGVDETSWHELVSDNRTSLQQIMATALLSLYGQHLRHAKVQAAAAGSAVTSAH